MSGRGGRDPLVALRRMDADLELHGRAWALDGDILRCRVCSSGQLASKGDRAFIHAGHCAAVGEVSDYPWRDLVKVLRGVPQASATISQIRQRLAQGETVSLQRRYVARVLEGLAANPQGTEQYRVTPRPGRMADLLLERI